MTAEAAPAAATVILALGSNLGSRLATLQAGVDVLCRRPGLDQVRVSPVYETEPVGGPAQPRYLNAVLAARTTLPASAVWARCQEAETALGRVREQRWGPRTLDADVIAYGDQVSADPQLILPHPRAHERAFVLAPWHDLDPDAVLPGHGRVAELLAVAGRTGICQLTGARLQPPP